MAPEITDEGASDQLEGWGAVWGGWTQASWLRTGGEGVHAGTPCTRRGGGGGQRAEGGSRASGLPEAVEEETGQGAEKGPQAEELKPEPCRDGLLRPGAGLGPDRPPNLKELEQRG